MTLNYKHAAAAILGLIFLSGSCSKDDEPHILEPQISFSIEENQLELTTGDSLVIEAINKNGSVFQQEWLVNDTLMGTSSTYTFTTETTGEYNLIYHAFNQAGDFTESFQITVMPRPVEVSMSIQEKEIDLVMGDSLVFSTVNENNAFYSQEWLLEQQVVSTANDFVFKPENAGSYSLTYTASNASGSFTHEYLLNVTPRIRPITETSNAYVTELLEFLPAPGQFINKNPGNLASAEGTLEGTGLVSLGAWGGSISYGFDHTVLNQEGADLIIYGNPQNNFSEPGVIFVMQDDNANGLPDDTWFEIKGSAHDHEGADRNYSVTYFRPEAAQDAIPWEDNKGNSGVVETNNFHRQSYYPEWIVEDSYTISGTLLPDSNIDMSNPSFITSMPFDYGYADNTVGSDRIDLSDAMDDQGNPVQLSGIDFIKIQTGVQANMGWLGELSTEISGVADLSLIE